MHNKKKTHGKKPWVNYFSTLQREYYLSWWIANLGVVPLFLFSALRLVPHDLAFAFLLLLVTAVLETILPLLYRSTNACKFSNSFKYLPVVRLNVKKIVTLALFFPFLSAYSAEGTKQDLILSIGEHRQFPASEVSQFAVTNRQVLSPKFTPKTGLIIKAKMQGFSELIIWSPKGEKKVWAVTILNKREQRQIQSALGQIQEMGLNFDQSGEFLAVRGSISTRQEYQQLFELKSKVPQLQLFVEMSPTLKKELLTEIYLTFYSSYIDSIKCKVEQLHFGCQIAEGHQSAQTIINKLQTTTFITVSPLPIIPPGQNIKLKLKLIQMEKADGSEVSLGLDQLNAPLKDIVDGGLESLIEKNQVLLRQFQTKIESLAEPQLIIQLGEEAKFSLGSEIPFTTQAENGEKIVTNWKFAGLDVHVICQVINGQLIIKYNTKLSTANGNVIDGNGQTSQASIELGTPLELFDISLKGTRDIDQSIPLISKIPIIGKIFSSTRTQSVNKKIIALAKVDINE